MKKLWKHEWKYHLFFTIALLLILILSCQRLIQNLPYYVFEDVTDVSEMNVRIVVFEIIWMVENINYHFSHDIVTMVLAVLLVKKGLIYYMERTSYGREFFQSLPICKKERFRFHLLMDTITIMVTITLSGVFECVALQQFLSQYQIDIFWLPFSYCGMVVSVISYVFMLLGFLYFVESIFVNGFMKIVGFGSGFLMIRFVISFIFDRFWQSRIVQHIYGFLSGQSVAGNYYTKITDPNYDSLINGATQYYTWVHEHLNPPMLFMGETVDYGLISEWDDYALEMLTSLNRLYDFTNPSSYVLYVVGYLVIAILLEGIAYVLIDKQELSKEVFYFEFARYLVSGLLAIAYYVMLVSNQMAVWHQILCAISAVLVFCLLVHLLSPDRKQLRGIFVKK